MNTLKPPCKTEEKIDMDTTKQSGSTKLIENNNLQTSFVDSVRVSGRLDTMILLQLCSRIPSGVIEQSRSMMTKDFAKKLINALALRCDYYPVKTEDIKD